MLLLNVSASTRHSRGNQWQRNTVKPVLLKTYTFGAKIQEFLDNIYICITIVIFIPVFYVVYIRVDHWLLCPCIYYFFLFMSWIEQLHAMPQVHYINNTIYYNNNSYSIKTILIEDKMYRTELWKEWNLKPLGT